MAIPTLPTALVEVTLAVTPRRGVPLAVTISSPPGGAEEAAAEPAGGEAAADPVGETAQLVIGPHADRLGVDAAWLACAGMTAAAGTVRDVAQPALKPSAGWVVGLGGGTERDYRKAGAALVRAADARAAADHKERRRVARSLQVALPPGVSAEQAAAFALGAVLGGYDFRVTGQERPPRTRILTLLVPAASLPELEQAVQRTLVLAGATALARDLANMPSNIKNPGWLADTAVRLAGSATGLVAKARDDGWLRAHGFGGVLAVGGGSASPGWSSSAGGRRPPARCRTWCWSARASRSTPAASRSSPRSACT